MGEAKGVPGVERLHRQDELGLRLSRAALYGQVAVGREHDPDAAVRLVAHDLPQSVLVAGDGRVHVELGGFHHPHLPAVRRHSGELDGRATAEHPLEDVAVVEPAVSEAVPVFSQEPPEVGPGDPVDLVVDRPGDSGYAGPDQLLQTRHDLPVTHALVRGSDERAELDVRGHAPVGEDDDGAKPAIDELLDDPAGLNIAGLDGLVG